MLECSDQGGLGQQITKQLQTRGQEVILIWPGEVFEQVETTQFQIDPTRPENFQQLLDQILAGNGAFCQGIVHLWALDEFGPSLTGSPTAAVSVTGRPVCATALVGCREN